MNNILNEILIRLKNYPEAEYEKNVNSITVKPKSGTGFPVTLTVNGNKNYTVSFGIWHEEFENELSALECFAFGLTDECRLKVTKKGNLPFKWTVESQENGIWKKGSTTGLFNLQFWKKTTTEYLQNDLIKNK